jgi:CBS domain containing-hemolysin-like protein
MQPDPFMAIVLKVLVVGVLVLLNGFFVAAEFALVKVRDTQLEPLVGKGQKRARVAQELRRNLDAYLSAAQLGITLASLGLGWAGEAIFEALLQPVFDMLRIESAVSRKSVAFAFGFTLITFLHIVVGEQAPKSFAIKKPLPTSLWVALPLRWFHTLAYPFIWVLNESSLWVLRHAGIESASEADLHHSDEELRLLVADAQRRAGATTFGRELVLNALDLRQRIVREVMRPRQEIVHLDTEASIAECLEVAERTRFSRFPLAEGGHPDRTLGVVHIKDLYAMRLKARMGRDLQPCCRRLIFVPETARLDRLLQAFLERRLHFAIVVDEYGGTTGMVTLENLLEEIVGQIQDEFDQEQPLCAPAGDGVWVLSGALPAYQLAELTGEAIPSASAATTSGFVTQRLGGFPKEGDIVPLGEFLLRVEAMDGARVERLKLTRRTPTAPSAAQLADS